MRIFRKSRERLMQEGMLRIEPDPVFGIPGMESLYDKNGVWCRSSKPIQNYYDQPVQIVSDTENPITHLWCKHILRKSTCSQWEWQNHKEWYEYRP